MREFELIIHLRKMCFIGELENIVDKTLII